MGLPAEKLEDLSGEIISDIGEQSSPLRPSLRLHVGDGSRNLSLMQSYAMEQAHYFWGVETEKDGENIPQTLLNKIGILKDTISVIPDLETYEPIAFDFVNGERNTKKEIEHFTNRRMGVELPLELSKKFKKTPITALDVYETPSVYEIAHSVLTSIENPVIRVIDAYEHYLLDEDIDPRAEKLGRTALMHFAFGAGGQPFVDLLGKANKTFHETELNLRKLKPKK